MDQQQQHSEDEQIPAPAKSKYPPGYRFMPTDRELIEDYLQKKIDKQPIPIAEITDTFLKEVNPRDLAAKYPKLGDKEWYIFTPQDRKYPNGARPDRASVSGYWKATGADTAIKVGGETVGYKKALVFYEGTHQNGVKTNWIMHEFRVPDNENEKKERTGNDKMRLNDWVLCRIYEKFTRLTNNRRNNNGNRSEKEQSGEDESTTLSSGDQYGESSQTTAAAAAVTNPNPNPNPIPIQERVLEILPENPYSYNYYPEQNMIDNAADFGFGDWSLQDMQQLDELESDPAGCFHLEQVNAFGNPQPQPLGFQHPHASSWINNGFQQHPNASTWINNGFQQHPNASSSWTNNGFQQHSNASSSSWSYSVPPNNNNTNNFSPFYSQRDDQQADNKRFKYN